MIEAQSSPVDGGRLEPGLSSEEVIQKTRTALREQLDRQPYLVLGVAAAVGYVMAAGVPRPVLSYLVRYGARAGLRGSLRSFLGSILPGHRDAEE